MKHNFFFMYDRGVRFSIFLWVFFLNIVVLKTGFSQYLIPEGQEILLAEMRENELYVSSSSYLQQPLQSQEKKGITSPHSVNKKLDYALGGGDILSINIYDEPDLSIQRIRVSLNGFINFPLIGKVQVDGLTVSQLEGKFENLLRNGYLNDPQVSVLIEEFRRRRIFILGAVSEPGSYKLGTGGSLLEMISKAGGVTPEAGNKFVILRSVDGESQVIPIDRKKLIEEGDLSLNIQLQDNDTIHVPLADIIYVFGAIAQPGSYQLSRKNRTILAAITLAGGFSDVASSKKTRIIRVTDGDVETIHVNVDDIIKRGDKEKDILLMPEDIIIVPESLF